MPDDEPPSAGETLEAFFRRRGMPPSPCPVCDTDDWGVSRAGSSYLCLLRIPADGTLRGTPRVVRLHVMVCQGCGFIRQHARRYVDGASDE